MVLVALGVGPDRVEQVPGVGAGAGVAWQVSMETRPVVPIRAGTWISRVWMVSMQAPANCSPAIARAAGV